MILLASGNSIRIVPHLKVVGFVDRNLLADSQVAEPSCNKAVFSEAKLISIEYKTAIYMQ